MSTLLNASLTELQVVGKQECKSFPHRLQGLRCQFDRCSQQLSCKERGVQKVKPLSTQGLPCQSDRSAKQVTSMIEQTMLDLSNPLRSFHRSTYVLRPLKTIETNGRTTQKPLKTIDINGVPEKTITFHCSEQMTIAQL